MQSELAETGAELNVWLSIHREIDVSVHAQVLKDNLESFMTLSELYDLAPLKHQTEVAAIEKMKTENMMDMFVFSNLLNADNPKEAAELLIKMNRELNSDSK